MNKIIAITAVILNLCPQGAIAMDTKSVIDIHCHTAGVGFGNSGCFISKKLQKSWKYKVYLKAFGVTEKEIQEKGDRLVIKRLSEKVSESRYVSAAVVLAMDGVVGADGELDREKTEMYIPNEFVAREVRQYNNLLFGASINPYRRDAIERLEKAAADGAVLVKWLPAIQNIDPADDRLIPFYLKMKELGLPLLTHTGLEYSFTRSNDELSDPERLRLPLSLGVTVIAAHSACTGRSHGEPNYDRLLRLCREYPNLYADISALTQMNRLGYLSTVLKQPELRGRLVYGSDMPLINTAIVSPYAFLFRIKPGRVLSISRMQNAWDRDIALKEELGAAPEVFTTASTLLKIQKTLPSVYTEACDDSSELRCATAQ
jgi:hypothetical protein